MKPLLLQVTAIARTLCEKVAFFIVTLLLGDLHRKSCLECAVKRTNLGRNGPKLDFHLLQAYRTAYMCGQHVVSAIQPTVI